MRAITVYRLEDGSNFSYHARHPIGSVLELRKYERVNNYKDLLRLAETLRVGYGGRRTRPHRRGSTPAGIPPRADQELFGGVASKISLLCGCLSLVHGRR